LNLICALLGIPHSLIRHHDLGRVAFGWNRHCEERNDEAIQRTKTLP
jgi:hypothetical protein